MTLTTALRPAIRARIVVPIALVGLVLAGPTVLGLILASAIIAGPGVALASAIFSGSTIGRVEHTLVAITIGIATLVLGGLVLDLIPGGLSLRTWFGYLLVVTDAALVLILLRSVPPRRPGLHQAGAVADWGPGGAGTAAGIRVSDLVLIGGGVAIAAGALAVATLGATVAPRVGFTQLWLLREPASSGLAQVGIESMEAAPTVYSLALMDAGRVVESWPRIALQPGERWERAVTLGTNPGAGGLEAVLERVDAPGVPYRRVSIAQGPPATP